MTKKEKNIKGGELKLATLNVWTMTVKGSELAEIMQTRKIDILCVRATGFKLFYCGVGRKRNGAVVVL